MLNTNICMADIYIYIYIYILTLTLSFLLTILYKVYHYKYICIRIGLEDDQLEGLSGGSDFGSDFDMDF